MNGCIIQPGVEGLMCEIASMLELYVQPMAQQGSDMSLIRSNFMVDTSSFKCLCAPLRYPISLCNYSQSVFFGVVFVPSNTNLKKMM